MGKGSTVFYIYFKYSSTRHILKLNALTDLHSIISPAKNLGVISQMKLYAIFDI